MLQLISGRRQRRDGGAEQGEVVLKAHSAQKQPLRHPHTGERGNPAEYRGQGKKKPRKGGNRKNR